jgi:[acyl-carrier-protein] S-malonyltransferase
MTAIMSPGQGAQRVGIFEPWLVDSDATLRLKQLAACCDFDLLEAGSTWTAEQLVDTRIAQPVIFAASLVAAESMRDAGFTPSVVLGHSVGEWCAAVLCGALSAEDAMTLVAARGDAMALACGANPSALAAILGGEREANIAHAVQFGLSVANDNATQIVVGGPVSAIESLAQNPPPKSRVMVLRVAGAFHTDAMLPAVDHVRATAASVHTKNPTVPFVSNLDGDVVDDGQQLLERLIRQIAQPVRWDLCVASLQRLGVDSAVEVAPAGTLTGIMRRAAPEIECFQVDSPADARTFVEHAP